MANLRQIKDTLTPDLRRKARAVRNKRPMLTAMGRSVVSLSKRAFTDSSLRPSRWQARKDNKPHNLLLKSTILRRSIRITGYGASSVTVGTDRKYGATHQLGSKKRNIPARPYMPIKGKRLTRRGDRAVTRALTSYLVARGIA